jgi:heme/copper-type cytochrome/quinol oxidase subunit 2
MNLQNILYQPYVISILIALIITLITYFIIKNNKEENDDDKEKNKNLKTLLYTFIISYILSILVIYSYNYFSKNNIFQKGGEKQVDPLDSLTMISDDVEIGLLED